MLPELLQGHVRIPNRLFEAIVSAHFTELQLRVVFAILRLSLGWQRRTVSASYAELAQCVGCRRVSGGFRDAMKGLVREGVILLMAEGGGADANAYGLQFAYEKWGKYSQSEAKLEAIWGKRPANADQLPLQILTLHPASPEAPPLPPQSQGPCLARVIPPASPESGSPDLTADAAADSTVGKTLKDIESKPPQRLGRGEAMELLTAVEDLKERHAGGPQGAGSIAIRIDKVRERFGADVARALKMIGGTGRLISQKPEHRGILVTDFMEALNRIREQDTKQETA